jgi:hypothetical protein
VTLEAAHDKLLAVDIDRLPAQLRAVLMNQPLFSVPLKAAGNGFEPERWPAAMPAEAPEDLFGKPGIKSWRDCGSLRPIFRGMPLRPVVEQLLSQPTAPQRIVAKAWLDGGTPLMLHLYRYRDFSQVSEVHWQVDPRAGRAGRVVAAPDFARRRDGLPAGRYDPARGDQSRPHAAGSAPVDRGLSRERSVPTWEV